MVKAIFLVISVILSITVKVSSLQCYVCYNCVEIKDEYIQACDSISPPSTTTPSTTISTTTSSTAPTTSSTTTSTEASTTSSTTTTEASTSSSTTTTTTTTTEAPTSSSITTEASRIDKDEVNYECFQGTINVNNSDVIVRGCAAGRTNETCDAFGLASCSFCSSDKCNAAASMQSSIMLLAVIFLSVALKEIY